MFTIHKNEYQTNVFLLRTLNNWRVQTFKKSKKIKETTENRLLRHTVNYNFFTLKKNDSHVELHAYPSAHYQGEGGVD